MSEKDDKTRISDIDRVRANGTPPTWGSDVLAAVEYDHVLKLQFCDLLEEIADQLPGRVDSNLAHGALHVLQTGFKPHVELEEQTLFPLLRRRLPDDAMLEHACAQLVKEHGRDTDFAHEIADVLSPLEMASEPENPEMLGYMLRGFFEGQRRHIDWENKVIIPLARGALVQSDHAEMRAWLEATNHRSFTDLLHLVVGKPAPDR